MTDDPAFPKSETAISVSDEGTNPLDRARWPRTDVGAARRFLLFNGSNVKFIADRGWAVWDGTRFDAVRGHVLVSRLAYGLIDIINEETAALSHNQLSEEQRLILVDELRGHDGMVKFAHVDREARKRLKSEVSAHRKFAEQYNNVNRMKAMLEAASHMQGTWTESDEFDRKIFVFNAANVRIDLQKLPPVSFDGPLDENLSPGFGKRDRADLATRISRVPFVAGATCKRFEAFLELIQPNPQMRRYLQKVFGYCLSGSISEQAVFLFQGEGANGKSTLLTTITRILGEYAMPCPVETFLRDKFRSGSSATPDIARLRAARLILASEPETDAVLSESRFKKFTGGEQISTREMYGRFQDFVAHGKVFLSFNRTPKIMADDDGTWRRLKIIPFPVQIPKEARRSMDDILAEFAHEESGILNWLIEGWRIFKDEGLDDPVEVVEASCAIRESYDLPGQFISDCCQKGEHERVLFKDIHRIAAQWFEHMGEPKLSGSLLGRILREKGFQETKVGKNRDRAYCGLRLSRPGEARHEQMASWEQVDKI